METNRGERRAPEPPSVPGAVPDALGLPGLPGTARAAAGGGRGLWWLLALWAASLLAAALAAPLVFDGVRLWAARSPGGLAGYLAGKDFPRYFDRLRWLFVLAGLPWVCRRTDLWGRQALALVGGRRAWRAAASWFAAGVGTVALIAAGQLSGGVASVRLRSGAGGALVALAEIVAVALVSAALIAFFEELVFRGVVFQLAARALALPWAVAAAALIFALVHFQRLPGDAWPEGAHGGGVGPAAGLVVAWRSLAALPSNLDPPVFTALVLAGAILCLVFARHRTLLASMGLHAGWVFAAGVHRRLLWVAPHASTTLWGGRHLIDGIAPLVLLAFLLLAVAWTEGRRRGMVSLRARRQR